MKRIDEIRLIVATFGDRKYTTQDVREKDTSGRSDVPQCLAGLRENGEIRGKKSQKTGIITWHTVKLNPVKGHEFFATAENNQLAGWKAFAPECFMVPQLVGTCRSISYS